MWGQAPAQGPIDGLATEGSVWTTALGEGYLADQGSCQNIAPKSDTAGLLIYSSGGI